MAEADNAFDALREFLKKGNEPPPQPGAKPAPSQARPPPRPVRRDASFVEGRRLGSQTCLFCHAGHAESFSRTLMGRIAKTQPGKLDCENCHGPGSTHVQAVGCAPCHGEDGISKRPGIPSLVGQDSQYLVPAMKAYVTGQRKHDLMRLVLTGVSEGEMRSMASYYARQTPERAKTPLIGDASAGRASTGLCAECHGNLGISVSPAFPSLAGQDSQYLADAIHAYKTGTRSKAIACAGCHGEGGISKKAGMPNLAGLSPQYLLPALKAYANGKRKNGVMAALLSGVDDAQLNSFALHYAQQNPARAQTPGVGNPAAGKAGAALCVGCHGEAAGSESDAVPSLAGQDARYLRESIKAYKDGSRHKIVACAECHGERGVSKKAGMPRLAGLSPQYLGQALKAYADGRRKDAVMTALLSGLDDAQINNLALYYAQQNPAQAQTAAVGNPAAGKTAAALCIGCHGEAAGSLSAAIPSLAGQDARYLRESIKAYKDGSRHKIVACAECHGERGVTSRPGTPSLAGLAPQYLVGEMKDYASGRRKHGIMNALLADVSDTEMNDIAQFYARQAPARAGTSTLGDPNAGRNISVPCAGCHGQQGMAQSPIPSLAGQDAQYLADTLREFKNGSRTNAIMSALVRGLDETAINNLAGYYASLAPTQPALPGGAQGPVASREPAVMANKMLASLDDRTVDDIAGYYASLVPARPALPGSAQARPAGPEPEVVANKLLASLDDRAADDIAGYFASLAPTRAGKPGGASADRREPVVVRNNLVAALNEQAVRNVGSYYASLAPAQPAGAGREPREPQLTLVNYTRPADGSSPGGIVSFRKNDPSRRVEQNNAICLNCHERGERTYWNGSTHEVRGVACTECHTVMRPVSRKFALKTEIEMETCFQCHKDRRAQIFRSAHMPLREGKMSCSNCHNPHGSATEAMLKENSINDTCYKCHAEKRGPFLFEHAPVRENCLSCHDPHGSSTEYMLKVSRPRLCAECHGMGHGSLANGPKTVETFGRSCQNCHTNIHGSNSPSGALFQR
ncbi:MAG: DmsE family decaheme c-type cytochrome [Bradyrhizobium sp.]